ncbi:ABC transporter substrate-binding protein [Spirochaetia bacterium]|nr:ABC transporter substrate-binding protein [Spirochaetia bacterium]
MKSKHVLLALALTFAAIINVYAGGGGQAASGSAAKPGQKKVLRVMVWGSTVQHNTYLTEFYKLYPDFAAKCTVEYIVGGANDAECAEKMRLALVSGESIADINHLNYTQVPEFARAGALSSLDSIIAPVRNDLLDGFRILTEYEGKTVAVPSGIKPRIWFYLKDIFDQAGVDPTKVKTLDDFIAAGKKVQALNPKYKIWSLGPSDNTWMYSIAGTGSKFADDKGNYLLTSDPNFAKVIEAFKKLKTSGVVADYAAWTPDWEKAFADEVLVSYLSANWLSQPQFLPKWAGEAQKGKWYAAQWPSLIGETGGSDAGGGITVVPTYAAEPELAKEYLKLRYFTAEGYFLQQMINFSTPPLMKSWVNDPRAKAPDAFIGGDYAGETVKAIGDLKIFPYDPAAQLELSIIVPHFDSAMNGVVSTDTALKNAQADLINQIGNPWTR